jgi:hypothetical protein
MESRNLYNYEEDYTIEKTWGRELVLVNNDLYCYKELVFDDELATSIHFHKNKKETFFVKKGKFNIEIYHPETGEAEDIYLCESSKPLTIEPLTVHRIIPIIKNSILIEISTSSEDSDSYRVKPR